MFVRTFAGLGSALRLLQRDASMTQDQVAEAAGLALSTVNRAFNDKAPPDLANLDAMLEAMGFDAHDLARALDRANGRAAFPGAPRDLLARARVLLAEKEVADSKLDECLEEIRASATRGSA